MPRSAHLSELIARACVAVTFHQHRAFRRCMTPRTRLPSEGWTNTKAETSRESETTNQKLKRPNQQLHSPNQKLRSQNQKLCGRRIATYQRPNQKLKYSASETTKLPHQKLQSSESETADRRSQKLQASNKKRQLSDSETIVDRIGNGTRPHQKLQCNHPNQKLKPSKRDSEE